MVAILCREWDRWETLWKYNLQEDYGLSAIITDKGEGRVKDGSKVVTLSGYKQGSALNRNKGGLGKG